jgi:voltage-gated potassium channel Kch
MTPSAQSPYSKHAKLIRRLCNVHDPELSKVLLLERLVLLCLSIVFFLCPSMLVRFLGGLVGRTTRKIAIELYVLGKTAASFALLFGGLWNASWHPALSVALLIDLFVNIIAIVLMRGLWRAPLSLNRTLISLGFNFLEFTAWFAGLYLYFHSLSQDGVSICDPSAAYYFSVVTAATVGYGDIIPSSNGRWLVVSEIFCSSLFLAIIVAYIIGSLNPKEDDDAKQV